VVVADLIRRMSLSTNDPERMLEQEATCLIDEIDAHLHPRWQEVVVPGLRAMFPNVQFIATTHSEIVVSTVEPKNVFRLEKNFATIRQDRVFHGPERSVVSISKEVFDIRQGTVGRRWILEPSPEILGYFWTQYGDNIPPSHEVSVAEGKVLLEGLRDVHGTPPPGLAGHVGPASLFFVDEIPEANWSHACTYYLLPDVGEPFYIKHVWPPGEAVRLIPLPRPVVT